MAEILLCRACEGRRSSQLCEEVWVEIQDAHVICTVCNDLNVGAEVKLGEGSEWKIVYPQAQLKMAVDSMDVQPQLSVRLRDDPNVCGVCTVVQGSTLQLSSSFGDFGEGATKHFQEEEAAAEEESRLRKQRQKEIDQKLSAEVTQAILWGQMWAMISFFLCLLIVLTGMISSTVASFNPLTDLQCVGLAGGLPALHVCGSCALTGLWLACGGDGSVSQLRDTVRAVHPELQQYEPVTAMYEATSICCNWCKNLTTLSCCCCAPLVSLGCVVAMTVAFTIHCNAYPSFALWGAVISVICYGGIWGWRQSQNHPNPHTGTAELVLVGSLCMVFCWPYVLLAACGLADRFVNCLLKPTQRSLVSAIHTTHEHTIVFEGNVLPKRDTVCSWPGKYETAWSELVAGSRHNDISAAVVFLPKASEDFGFHDPIPAKFAKQDLQDLHGECWCTPLYGEQKPWGCRWWSKWIANIKLAVSQECTLVVYYFNDMKGKGKVENFTTAGKEHMRREAIFRCQDAFLKSDSFKNALEAGLKHLSKEKGPDCSSSYSREVHRLFLASLPEEDRHFLEASEGLGNLQKGEVAWLERNGFPYVEKEVWELASSSPKAIGRSA